MAPAPKVLEPKRISESRFCAILILQNVCPTGRALLSPFALRGARTPQVRIAIHASRIPPRPVRARSHGQHMVSTWPAHGQHMVSTWSARGQHMVSTWSAHGQHMVSARSARGQHTVSTRSAHGQAGTGTRAHGPTYTVHEQHVVRLVPVHTHTQRDHCEGRSADAAEDASAVPWRCC